MGQKVNPLGFRLGITQKHRSHWFIIKKKYSQLTIEDYFLRKKIFYNFADAGITNIGIHRKLDQIKIEIQTARPASLVGRDGNRLGELKINLEEDLKKFRKKNVSFYRFPYIESFEKPQIALHVTKLSNPDSEAVFIADFLVKQIEKRILFRRAIKQAIQRAQRGRIKGIKIQISGRLNGAEIARSEWVREGRVPLQTLNANIDYSFRTAKTIYGIIGVKIWIFKGEKEL